MITDTIAVIRSMGTAMTGPRWTNPKGYPKGPVANNKFTIVAEAAMEVIGGFFDLVAAAGAGVASGTEE